LLKPHVIVYSRPGCHLCDEAKEAIRLAGCDEAFTLEEINIETSRELLLKYQFEIPVVTIDGNEAFRHRVEPQKFREWFAGND
jgi:glutaredoxin